MRYALRLPKPVEPPEALDQMVRRLQIRDQQIRCQVHSHLARRCGYQPIPLRRVFLLQKHAERGIALYQPVALPSAHRAGEEADTLCAELLSDLAREIRRSLRLAHKYQHRSE